MPVRSTAGTYEVNGVVSDLSVLGIEFGRGIGLSTPASGCILGQGGALVLGLCLLDRRGREATGGGRCGGKPGEELGGRPGGQPYERENHYGMYVDGTIERRDAGAEAFKMVVVGGVGIWLTSSGLVCCH
jgi:hypothetical protein